MSLGFLFGEDGVAGEGSRARLSGGSGGVLGFDGGSAGTEFSFEDGVAAMGGRGGSLAGETRLEFDERAGGCGSKGFAGSSEAPGRLKGGKLP